MFERNHFMTTPLRVEDHEAGGLGMRRDAAEFRKAASVSIRIARQCDQFPAARSILRHCDCGAGLRRARAEQGLLAAEA